MESLFLIVFLCWAVPRGRFCQGNQSGNEALLNGWVATTKAGTWS